MRLEGKVAIVTGAARGMGEAEARLFAREGAKVIIADMSEEDARKVESDIRENGGEAAFVSLDVTHEGDWKSAVEKAASIYGKLDILVNNAGISGVPNADDMSTEAWDRVMDVNSKGVFLGVKYAIPEMLRAGGGSIVNISSISGFIGQPYTLPAYNASKGAVRILTKSFAVKYAEQGIRVNSVHPGVMPPMKGAAPDPERRQKTIEGIPMKRAGRVEEVANAVLFLASDEASYITGTELVVDGGFLAL